MKRQKIEQKRGISSVITTVILILISITAIGIVYSFLIPMIRQGMEKGKSCFELRDYIKVEASDYTCYDSTQTKLKISRGFDEVEIRGIVVKIHHGEEADVFKLINNAVVSGVNNDVAITLPNPGDSKVYNFTVDSGEKADIGVILSTGKICDPLPYNIPPCSLS